MSTTNGDTSSLPSQDQLIRVERMVNNILSARMEWMRRITGGDPRRDISEECGYNANPSVQDYQDYFDRHAIAGKVNSIWVKATWKVQPNVYEDEDSEADTAFEEAWDGLGKQLTGEESFYEEEEGSPIWDYLRRVDDLSGIGHYGVLLLGLDDGLPLNEPVRGYKEVNSFPSSVDPNGATASTVGIPTGYTPSNNARYSLTINARETAGRKLLYLSVFPESLAQIVRWETNRTSPRFGHPLVYRLNLTDPAQQSELIAAPQALVDVHWTRVIHVADTFHHAGSSQVTAVPRMQPVLDNLYNLKKVYGADAEAYWKNCLAKVFLETLAKDGGDVEVDHAAIKDMFEKAGTGLQPYYFLRNMTGKTLPPIVTDPTAHIAIQIEAICIKLDIPMRIFMGSERGQLASGQDQIEWNNGVRGRQTSYVTPRIIVPFVNRLIGTGVLPRPTKFCCSWPEVTSQSDLEKAQIALAQTQADAAYVAGNVESIIPPHDYLSRVRGFTEEEATAILDSAVAHHDEAIAQDVTDTQTKIDAGVMPDPAAPKLMAGPDGKPMTMPAPVKNEATATPTIVVSPPNVVVNVPSQPLEIHTHHTHTTSAATVNVEPPHVNVTMPEQPAPQVTVNLPEQVAPTVQVNVPACPAPVVQVDVAAPNVVVNTPAITNEVNVPAPVVEAVNVTAQVVMPEPATKTVVIKRTAEGKYEGTVEEQ